MTVSIEEQIDAKNFYDSAVLFCKKAESLSNAVCLNPSDLILLIMQIYTIAMHLPNTEPSTWQADEIPTSPDISFATGRFMIHLYWKNLFVVPSQMICEVFLLTYPRVSFSMSKAILQMRFGNGGLISETIGAFMRLTQSVC